MAGRKRKTEDRSIAAHEHEKISAEQDDGDRRPKSQVRGGKIDAKIEKASWKSKQKNERDRRKLLAVAKSKSSDKNQMRVKSLGHSCPGAH
jgi:hypothetical protein